uniref:Uncharacterized protein n=1 Tax=Anguilla anguilla TaxID=7936 RepID=A0A0E9RLH5_ANGAN
MKFCASWRSWRYSIQLNFQELNSKSFFI